MANSLQPGTKFKNLVNYLDWTDSIMHDLACSVDLANITTMLSVLEQTIRDLNVRSDFRNWLSNDILHTRHTLEDLHDAICASTLSELSTSIDTWHEHLMDSLSVQWDSPVLCCGPGAVEDFVLPADGFLQLFITSDLEAIASTRKPGDVANDKADVIALLWQAAKQPGQGLKPFLDDPQLRKDFEKVFDSFDFPPRSQLLGGAQIIMASANRQIGIEADVAWPYHPKQVAKYGGDPDKQLVRRVVIRDGNQVELLPFSSYDLRRPHRQSYILTISAGMDLVGVQASGNDRVIFRSRRYCTSDWSPDRVTLKCRQGQISIPSGWLPQEWPSLPLLGTVKAGTKNRENQVIFHAADDVVLRKLAQTYKRFIWNGIQILGDPEFDREVRQSLAAELAHQLAILHSEGAQIYVEISGVPKLPELIKSIIAGNVLCVGINQTELLQLTSSGNKDTNPVWAWPNPTQCPESLLERCQRGVCLARYLATDIFVHGNECNLYITRSRDEERLKKIVLVILAATLIVVSLLLDRGGTMSHVERPSLAEKGFMALLQFAYDFARSYGNCSYLRQILNTGSFCARNDSEFSFVIVPVAWPEEVQRVNTSGAGDMIAGIVAALLPS